MRNNVVSKKGFTLVEMLLVLAVASAILLMIINYSVQKMDQMRIDKATLQMQQILNAGLTYYVNQSEWPASILVLQTAKLLPTPFASPWGSAVEYKVATITTTEGGTEQGENVFQVSVTVPGLTTGPAVALVLAGRLPNGTVSGADKTTVNSQVTIPGQNLNNARSINFASVYNSGACVPAPSCPGNMNPSIFVVPAEVNGVVSPQTTVVYPITSFTAFARGDDLSTGAPSKSNDPYDCGVTYTPAKVACNLAGETTPNPAGYWRVCLSVYTQNGGTYPTTGSALQGVAMGTILAVTRCTPANEKPVGTGFGIFTPNSQPQQ